MGFLSKKPNKNKVYSLKEAMNLVNKYPNFTAVETTGGFKVVEEKMVREHINGYKERRNSFMQEISGNGAYKNMPNIDNFNEGKVSYQRYSEWGR